MKLRQKQLVLLLSDSEGDKWEKKRKRSYVTEEEIIFISLLFSNYFQGNKHRNKINCY